MNLNIVLGINRIDGEEIDRNLVDIVKTDNIIIQSDENDTFCNINNGNNDRLIIFGNIIGRTAEDIQKEFQKSISKYPIEYFINKMEGRFIAVKITDNQCEISCDRFARADLYYTENSKGAIFSTSLSNFKNRLNSYNQISILYSLYIYGYRPPKKETFYDGINRLGVSEVVSMVGKELSFRLSSPKISNTEQYDSNQLQKYSELLLNSIDNCGSPDGNIVYLSSGWDSTSILGCLVKLYGAQKVKAVIGRMNYSKRTGIINSFELDRAKAVADYYGVKLEIAELDYFQRGPELIEKYKKLMRSQMLSSMTFFNHTLLAEHISKEYNGEAVFCGEISDGVHNLGFSQFVTVFHPVLDFREYSDKMGSYLFGPTFYKSILDGSYNSDFIYNSLKNRLSDCLFDNLDRSNPGLQLLSSFFLRDNRFPFWSLSNSKIFTELGRQEFERKMQQKYLLSASEDLKPDNMYSWYNYLYNSFHWQGGTVATLDHTASENGFDIRLPFWDSQLHDFLSKMPEDWGRGLDFNHTKYPLKSMLKNEIDYPNHLQTGPHSYLYDVDHSFNHAAEFIYASAFMDTFKDLLKKREYRNIFSDEYIDIKYFDGIVDNYLNGNEAIGSERNDLVSIIFFSLECE
jgi:asparagine synthetase B (glutamine-hydrolysing)